MRPLKSLGILLVCLFVISCKSDSIYNIKYTDQYNNHYLLTQDTFLYDPADPQESLSTIDNNKNPVNREIEKRYFEEIAEVVRHIMSDTTTHSRQRTEGNSILVVTRGNLNDKFILVPSQDRDQLEKLLQALIIKD